MRIVFLGTLGWYSTRSGNTSCVLVDSADYYVVFDAGDGIYKLDRHIGTLKPINILLSHLHLDHIIGLHIFRSFDLNKK